MENMHTEKTLKSLNKVQLLAIAAANGIEVVDDTKNEDIRALILAKGCPVMGEEADNQPQGNSNIPKYTKEQFVKSNWYSHRRDVLNTILEDDKTYSHADVDKLISEFMKREVK